MNIKPNNDWQTALAHVITDVQQLCDYLQLSPQQLSLSVAQSKFNLRVPHSFAARMQKANPCDPLLLQILPQAAELVATPGYTQDPLAEKKVNQVPGLLHKYQGRVLLLVAGECAVHCRYCFRQHFPYVENIPGKQGWQHALNYIAQDNSISEVIYSGGDPLIAKDSFLTELTAKVAAIPHVQRLRIHTRLPIVIPQRVNDELIGWLSGTRLQPIMVLHCNHAQEIDDQVVQAVHRLRSAQIIVLNQSVLLKNINDTAAALMALSEKLFAAGIMPYYLNVVDAVQGAAHFAVPVEKARQLLTEIRQQLSGYLVPKLVQEQAGAGSKLPVG